MPALFVAAERRELAGLLKFCRNVKPLGWPVYWARAAELNGTAVALVTNGAGRVRAAGAVDAARSHGNIDWICSMGYCGALENGMKVGDIFVAGSVRTCGREYAATKAHSELPQRSGILVSIDHVAQTAEEKRQLRSSGAAAVDMEAGGVAEKAAEMRLPFYCVRSVTDLADESFHLDLNSALRPDGRFDTMRLIAATCRQPRTLLPELVRLGRRSRVASQTLGEFIAGCRF